TIIGSQVAHLAENLPEYQATITRKLTTLRGSTAQSGVVERASSLLKDLGTQVKKAPVKAPATTSGPVASGPVASETPAPKPIPVEIQEPPPTPLQLIQSIVAPLLAPLATTGIVVVF